MHRVLSYHASMSQQDDDGLSAWHNCIKHICLLICSYDRTIPYNHSGAFYCLVKKNSLIYASIHDS